jgi:hypothetical protein
MAKVLANDEDYPDYELSFEGELVGSAISVRGPHSFMLPALAPDVDIKVVVTHKDADPGVPNLKIEIRRRRPNDP